MVSDSEFKIDRVKQRLKKKKNLHLFNRYTNTSEFQMNINHHLRLKGSFKYFKGHFYF